MVFANQQQEEDRGARRSSSVSSCLSLVPSPRGDVALLEQLADNRSVQPSCYVTLLEQLADNRSVQSSCYVTLLEQLADNRSV